jgi:hypothetical protein
VLVVIVALEVTPEMEKNDNDNECALIVIISLVEATPKI